MEVGEEEIKHKIKNYLNLDRPIRKLNYLKQKRKEAFYDQTFTRVYFEDETGLVPIKFNVEKEVIEHLDATMLCDKRIDRIKLKQRYVNDYLQALDPMSRSELTHKYKTDIKRLTVTQLDMEFYDEILEIEEAINFMEGIKPDIKTDHIQIEKDKPEDNFQAISEMLGV